MDIIAECNIMLSPFSMRVEPRQNHMIVITGDAIWDIWYNTKKHPLTDDTGLVYEFIRRTVERLAT